MDESLPPPLLKFPVPAAWLADARAPRGVSLLHAMAEQDDADLAGAQRLVRACAGGLGALDEEGRTPLMCAVSAGRLGAARVLLALGAEPATRMGAQGLTLAQAALGPRARRAGGRSLAMFRYLVDGPETGGWREAGTGRPLWLLADHTEATLLHHLVRNGQDAGLVDEVLGCLAGLKLGHGSKLAALLDAANAAGRTALMEAESAAVAAVLLRWGADTGARDPSGATAAHWAAYRGRADILGLLSASDLAAVDRWGRTVLHEACSYGRADAARHILARATSPPHLGVLRRVTLAPSPGLTPLACALRAGSEDTALVLLQSGASAAGTVPPGDGDGGGRPARVARQVLEWAPGRAEALKITLLLAAHVGADLAAVVLRDFRCAGGAMETPTHAEIVEHIRAAKIGPPTSIAARVVARRRKGTDKVPSDTSQY